MVPTHAMLAYGCVPPVEAGSAYAPQAIADYDADGILVLESVDREQVLADHLVFRQTCKRLKDKPCAVLFASATHKQPHRYYSRTPDPKASGTNTLSFDRQADSALSEPFVVVDTASVVQNRLQRSPSDVGSA